MTLIRLTTIDGQEVVVPRTSITLVKEYPAGQTWVETTSAATPILQVQESVEEVQRLMEATDPG